jgi:ribonuclease P protein component
MHTCTDFSFPKKERLLKRKDFVNLNQTGRRLYSKNFLILLKKNGLPFSRLGVTVTKKIGKAVKRNRIKRLVREFFRLNKSRLPKGYDICVIARSDVSKCKLQDIKEELGDVLFGFSE